MNKWQKIGLGLGITVIAVVIGYESVPFIRVQVDNIKNKLKRKPNEK